MKKESYNYNYNNNNNIKLTITREGFWDSVVTLENE